VYSKFQLAKKYLHYYITAENGHGHGIHSPFVFDFIKNVLNDKKIYPAYLLIENLRKQLLTDNTIINVEDFGAGSIVSKTKQRSISEIAHNAAKPKKYAQLIYRIVNYYQPKICIELGTSLGISTAYISLANNNGKVFSLEGSQEISKIASNNFAKLCLQNITLITGNFDETLSNTLIKSGKIDFAFIDGNHREEPTLRYFSELLINANPSSIFIFDDIHWSEEMESAWQKIKQHPQVLLTVDLFFIGIVFFKNDFKQKQDFTIRF
jgi:predicted O-methyltransferase YrrM